MINVMIVDDNKVVIKTMKNTINWQKYGMTVVSEAENGRIALEIIKGKQIDLVFTDIKMPHMDGIELIRRVHEFSPEIVFVIISSYSDFNLVRKGFIQGATDYILKFDIDNFQITDALLSKLNFLISQNPRNELNRLILKTNKPESYLEAACFTFMDVEIKLGIKNISVTEHLYSLTENKDNIVFALSKEHLHILVYSEEPGKNNRVCKSILTSLDDCKDSIVSVGISFSKSYGAVQWLPGKASAAQGVKFYFNNKWVFCFEEERINENEFLQSAERFLHKLCAGKNFGEILELINSIFDLAEKHLPAKEKLIEIMKNAAERLFEWIINEFGYTPLPDKGALFGELSLFINFKNCYIGEITRWYDENINTDKRDLFRAIDGYMKSKYKNPLLSLNDLEQELNVSGRVISKSIKTSTGEHFKQYLNRIRLAKAKELLKYSGLRVNEIARMAGYSNVEHFSRIFSLEVGVTPSQYAEIKRD